MSAGHAYGDWVANSPDPLSAFKAEMSAMDAVNPSRRTPH